MKMKNILKIFVFCFGTFLLFNCSNEDKIIDTVFDNVQGGAILRTIKVNRATFKIDDPSTKWSIIVEEQDGANGALFSEIKLYATHTSSDGVNSEEVFLKSIPASSFTPGGENGYLRGEVSASLAETLIALNLSASDYTNLDNFTIRLELILRDGRKFSVDDNSPRVTGGSYFSSPFQYTVEFFCPLENASLYNGDYKVIEDAWKDYKADDIIPVVYDSSDGLFTFRILNINNPFILNTETSYMIVTVNPEDGSVAVVGNEVFDYDGYTPEVTGEGFVGTCNGKINLKLNFDNDKGYELSLEKVN